MMEVDTKIQIFTKANQITFLKESQYLNEHSSKEEKTQHPLGLGQQKEEVTLQK